MIVTISKRLVLASLAAFAFVSGPATAAPKGITEASLAAPACALTNIMPTASECSGFFTGNLLSNSRSDIATQQSGLAAINFAWDGQFANVSKISSLNGGTTVDFATANQNPITRLYGDTWIGLHFGKGAGFGSDVTGFWRFNAGTTGLANFVLGLSRGSSGAVVYKTGSARPVDPQISVVPEPLSWTMMVAGFGLVGVSLRRRSRNTAAA